MLQLSKAYEGFSRNSDESNEGHSNKVMALKYFPTDTNMFVTGGWDNQLKVLLMTNLNDY